MPWNARNLEAIKRNQDLDPDVTSVMSLVISQKTAQRPAHNPSVITASNTVISQETAKMKVFSLLFRG